MEEATNLDFGFGLVFSSEAHRNTLLKVLKEAYVLSNMIDSSFKNLVTTLLASNQITFSNDKLPPKGTGHINPYKFLWRAKTWWLSGS